MHWKDSSNPYQETLQMIPFHGKEWCCCCFCGPFKWWCQVSQLQQETRDIDLRNIKLILKMSAYTKIKTYKNVLCIFLTLISCCFIHTHACQNPNATCILVLLGLNNNHWRHKNGITLPLRNENGPWTVLFSQERLCVTTVWHLGLCIPF